MLMVALAAAGCTAPKKEPPTPVITAPPPTKADIWQRVASTADLNRIRRVATGWSSGLAKARARVSATRSGRRARLLDPDAALPRPAPTPGKL